MDHATPRQPAGQRSGGQFASKQHAPADLHLTDEESQELWSTAQLALSVVVEQAKVDGYAVGTDDTNTVRITDTPDGRDYTVTSDDTLRVSTTDATGREHSHVRPGIQYLPRDYDSLRFALDRVRTAAASNEALTEAISEVDEDAEANFTSGDFLLDHEVYGDIWALGVDGGQDGYIITPHIDPVSEEMTGKVVVQESGDIEPAAPEVQAEVFQRATGIADADKAAEYAEKVGVLAMARFRKKMTAS